jgi:hypothetical protein
MSATLEQVEQTVANQPAILQAISDTNAAVKLQGDDIAEIAAILQEQDKRIKALEDAAKPKVINVKDYAKGDGIAYDDDAIMAAQDKALAASLPLYFPAGNYLCRQSRVVIKSGAKWQGEAGARLFTKESSVYNIAFKVADQAKDVSVDGLAFDQMEDAIQLPLTGSALKGCHLVHVGTFENLKFNNNKLLGYGITLFMSQPYADGKFIEVKGNQILATRRVNQYYDHSSFNIEALDGLIENNTCTCIKTPGIDDYKLESAFEIHMPKGIIRNNTAVNYVNAYLLVGWLQTFPNNFPLNSPKDILIEKNTATKCIRAIAFWGDHAITGQVFSNVKIYNNILNIGLEKYGTTTKYYYPACFIGCINGGADKGIFKNFEIAYNDMTTYSEVGFPANVWNYGAYIDQSGAINLVGTSITPTTGNRCEDWNIHDNTITYPYSVFMLRSNNKDMVHDRITVRNNVLKDCTYMRLYDPNTRGFDAVYVMENAKNILAEGNTVSGIKPLAMTKYGANVGNSTIK